MTLLELCTSLAWWSNLHPIYIVSLKIVLNLMFARLQGPLSSETLLSAIAAANPEPSCMYRD